MVVVVASAGGGGGETRGDGRRGETGPWAARASEVVPTVMLRHAESAGCVPAGSENDTHTVAFPEGLKFGVKGLGFFFLVWGLRFRVWGSEVEI